MTRPWIAAAVAALGLLTFAPAAGAETLGVTSAPTGAQTANCFGPVFVQATDPATATFTVDTPGEITQWQTIGSGDEPGSSLTLTVLSPQQDGSLLTVATDTETVPNTIPSNGVLEFTPATPIPVQAGGVLGLYGSSPSDTCFFYGGDVSPSASLYALRGTTLPPPTGEVLVPAGPGQSPPTYELDLAATLVTTVQDASVTSSALPSTITTGGTSVLSSLLTNNGPGVGQLTVTDQVPSGLKVVSAQAGLGTCAVASQTVSCTISGLPVGSSVPVDVVVSAATAGSYDNQVSVGVQQGYTDPSPANNDASATLTVTAPPPAASTSSTNTQVAPQQVTAPRSCIVPSLRHTPLGVIRGVLRDLGCRVRLLHRHSKLHKGVVIRVLGRTGRFPYHRLVRVLVSSGPRSRHARHRKRH